MQKLENLSMKELYIILLRYYKRPINRVRLLWSIEEEELEKLDRYIDLLDNPHIRLSIMERLLELGLSIDKIVEAMDWRGFESLVSEFFRSYGYKVYGGYRIRRFEYDIIAVKGDILISIDCKHWDRPLPPSKARDIAKMLIRRSREINIDRRFKGKKIYMAIISMRGETPRFIDGVALIPILYIKNFIEEIPSLIYLGYLKEANEL
ncbi:MAG TPA: hypothetical protein EYH44_05415 [Thermoprotei archaeon]|nr:hypothetical protein [Thermoprotei archaeon]